MSDLLIKGMEIPKRCNGCFNSRCLLFFEHTDPNNSRHPNCPISELPQHGRLIDAVALKGSIEGRILAGQGVNVFSEIDNAPTVLEASDGCN